MLLPQTAFQHSEKQNKHWLTGIWASWGRNILELWSSQLIPLIPQRCVSTRTQDYSSSPVTVALCFPSLSITFSHSVPLYRCLHRWYGGRPVMLSTADPCSKACWDWRGGAMLKRLQGRNRSMRVIGSLCSVCAHVHFGVFYADLQAACVDRWTIW